MNKITTYKELLDRVKSFKIDQNIDLSSGEDLSIGIMNLISIEEHLFFTSQKLSSSQKTEGSKYLDFLNEIRKMRTELMREIIKDYEGENWCISKHLLAASMRVMEVGTKELKKGDKKRAESLFKKAYRLYSLFWGLNLSGSSKLKPGGGKEVSFIDEKGMRKEKESVFSKLGNLVQKAVDCCRE